jgi:hypothetical protein
LLIPNVSAMMADTASRANRFAGNRCLHRSPPDFDLSPRQVDRLQDDVALFCRSV